jgi:hypothetical protein
MSDTSSKTPKPPSSSKTPAPKPRPAMAPNSKLIGRSVIRSGAPKRG